MRKNSGSPHRGNYPYINGQRSQQQFYDAVPEIVMDAPYVNQIGPG